MISLALLDHLGNPPSAYLPSSCGVAGVRQSFFVFLVRGSKRYSSIGISQLYELSGRDLPTAPASSLEVRADVVEAQQGVRLLFLPKPLSAAASWQLLQRRDGGQSGCRRHAL